MQRFSQCIEVSECNLSGIHMQLVVVRVFCVHLRFDAFA